MNLTFRKAQPQDAPAILTLYRQVVGTPGCAWDEEYPAMANIQEDLLLGALYVYMQDGHLVGAVSCGPFHELDELPQWSPADDAFELARLCIRRDWQGRGLAGKMLDALLNAIPNPIRLLVSPFNGAARHLYASRGFRPLGQTHMYDHDFILCERRRDQ